MKISYLSASRKLQIMWQWERELPANVAEDLYLNHGGKPIDQRFEIYLRVARDFGDSLAQSLEQ